MNKRKFRRLINSRDVGLTLKRSGCNLERNKTEMVSEIPEIFSHNK